jgi:mannose-6-phosphate isomerase-like protein (cupin superfamily)
MVPPVRAPELDSRPRMLPNGIRPDGFDTVRLLTGDGGGFEAVRRAWGRTTVLAPAAPEAVDLVSIGDIERWINLGELMPPRMALLIDGVPVPAREFAGEYVSYGRREAKGADPEKVRYLIAKGATVQLHPVDRWHEPAFRLSRRLAAAMRARVHVVAFLTPCGEYGRRIHVDDVHVFAIQIAGAKTWEIYPAAAGAEHGEPQQTVTLEPGDLLYVPAGLAHRACSGEQGSLHISVTIGEPSPRELAAVWIRDFLASVGLEDKLSGDRDARLAAAAGWRDAMLDSLRSADPAALLEEAESEWVEPRADWSTFDLS